MEGSADGEGQFRLLANNAPVMIWRSDTTKACDFFNEPWLRFTGRTMEQEFGFGWTEGVHPDDYDRCVKVYVEAFDARQEFSMDYRLRRCDGAYRWLVDNGRPYFAADGTFAGYFGSCIDIHDRKEDEERLNAALVEREVLLREKEGLLQEVHHRTRNNMQMIVSLLKLQSRNAPEGEVTRLDEAILRVRSIALTLDRAHQTSDFARVRLGAYLQELADMVLPQFSARNATIGTDVAAANNIELLIEVAVPLGLAVVELLSHAVRLSGSGTVISLSAACHSDGTVQITVEGLPSDAWIEESALGMRLVRRLAGQIKAQLDVSPEDRVTLALPPEAA